MILLKIVFLQIVWILIVKQALPISSELIWLLALLICFCNYFIYKTSVSFKRYLFLLSIFVSWGYLQDSLLQALGFLELEGSGLWLNSLWILFLCYFGDVFNKLNKLNLWQQSLLGAVGGIFSYYSGCKLSGIHITNNELPGFVFIIAMSWGVFMPLSLFLFYKDKFWNAILDKSIYYSFDSTGFKRHQKLFKSEAFEEDLTGKNILITGGTGGIGLSVCRELSKRGAYVIFTGRSEKRGKEYEGDNCKFLKLDMIDWASFKSVLRDLPRFDHIILNAGGMPKELELNDFSVEHQAASQLFGHFNLLDLLDKHSGLNVECRITWVSSGGMYLKKLDLGNLVRPVKYDKVDVYANVKRAQITLVEEMVKNERWKKYNIFSMHPGWVNTSGIEDALPNFYKFTKNRLRSIEQGADTINWLQFTNENLVSGSFYFDRKSTSAYINKQYRPSKDERLRLMNLVDQYTIK